MANELVAVRDNWLDLADRLKDLPMPFEQEIFLTECDIAGTLHVDDIMIKAQGVLDGTVVELVLRREPGNEHDKMAICVETPDGKKLGYVPKGENEILAHLMDAGKMLSARVVYKQVENHWLHIRMAIAMKEA